MMSQPLCFDLLSKRVVLPPVERWGTDSMLPCGIWKNLLIMHIWLRAGFLHGVWTNLTVSLSKLYCEAWRVVYNIL